MGCGGGCGGGGVRGGARGTTRWKVVRPDGKYAIKKTLADAELLKAQWPGSQIKKIA